MHDVVAHQMTVMTIQAEGARRIAGETDPRIRDALDTIKATGHSALAEMRMARRQVRSMVRWEAIVIALFGAILGALIGSGIGFGVVSSLADEGLGNFTFPGGQLAIWLVAAALAGVLASIGPARKAAKLDVLEAISYE